MVPPKLVELNFGNGVVIDVSPEHAFGDRIRLFLQLGEAGIPHRHHIASEFAAGLYG